MFAYLCGYSYKHSFTYRYVMITTFVIIAMLAMYLQALKEHRHSHFEVTIKF